MTVENHIDFLGTAASYIEVDPNHAVVADCSIRFKIAPPDWTPAAADYLFSKWEPSGNERGILCYLATNGALTFQWSEDGTAGTLVGGNTAIIPDTTDGEAKSIRVDVVLDNGSSQRELSLYVSDDDGETWTFVSTSTAAGESSGIHNSSAPFRFGGLGSSGASTYAGRFFWLDLLQGSEVEVSIDVRNLTSAELLAGTFAHQFGTADIVGDVWTYVRPKSRLAGKVPVGLWEADDGNKFGPPMIADRTGNRMHAQLGSTTGADTNDPLPKIVAVGDVPAKYMWLPDAVSDYAESADVNLLDADTAHLHQSIGEWIAGPGSAGLSLSTDLASLMPGAAYVIKSTHDGSVTGQLTMAGSAIPIDAATEYTASIWVYSVDGQDDWYIAITEYISTVAQAAQTATGVAIPAGVWTQLEFTFTTGASVDSLRLQAHLDDGSVGEVYYFCQPCLRTGSDGTFVPSSRVVGSIWMEANVASVDFASGSSQRMAWTRTANDGWGFRVALTGAVNFFHGDGSTSRAWSIDAPSTDWVNGEWFKITGWYDRPNAKAYGYINDVELSERDLNADPAVPTGNDVIVGGAAEPFVGDIEYVLIRDGDENGPIIRYFNAALASDPFDTVPDSYSDAGWTIEKHPSSDPVATLIDRDMLLAHTDDQIKIDYNALFDFADDDDFTIIIAHKIWPHTALGGRLLNRRSTYGYVLLTSDIAGDFDPRLFLDGASTQTNTDAEIATLAEMFSVWAAVRDADGSPVLYSDGEPGSPGTDSTGTLDQSGIDLYLMSAGGSTFHDGAWIATAIFAEALTAEEIAAVTAELTGDLVPGSLMLTGVGT